MFETRTAVAALAAVLMLPSVAAPADSYPSKPIRMILPFPAGGPTDILGRALGQKLAEVIGENVVPDNRAGAGGNIGLELAARSPTDGHTIVMSSPAIALSPSLYKKLAYDGDRDLRPVARVASMQNVMVVHPVVPAKTVKQFLALARARPGELNFGSGGAGTTNHLANELFMTLTKVKMLHVPYKGATLAALAMMSGEVDQVIVSVPSSLAFIRAGKVRPLAVLADKRVDVLPKVPTMREAGVSGAEMPIWYGVLVPSGVSDAIVGQLHKSIVAALNTPDLRRQLVSLGVDPWPGDGKQFAELIRTEKVRLGRIVEQAGIPKR